MEQSSDARGYFTQLDGVRAIAILAVILTHTWDSPDWPITDTILGGGWAGVNLFFVLSGFLITGVLWDARGKEGYYRNFYGRRALRIFPVFFLVMFFVFALWPHSPYLDPVRHRWPMYFLFMANIVVAMRGFGLRVTDVVWSLAVEEQFYLVWPTVVRRIGVKLLMRICAAVIVIEPFLRWAAYERLAPSTVKVLTIFQADSFAMGALMCLLMREKSFTPGQFRRAGKLLLLIAGPVFLSGLWLSDKTFYRVVIDYSVIGAASSGLILSALYSSRVGAWLSKRWITHIGKVSYGMYLYHAIVIVVMSKAAQVLHLPATRSILSSTAMFIAVTSVSVAVATVSFRYFELPFLRMKRFFTAEPQAHAVPQGATSA
jgi:peptidoglycan/LPS O-acetylase OafA/YrhL